VVGVVPVLPTSSLVPTVSYVGTLSGDVEVDLSFKLPGRVERIGPEAGRDWMEGDAVEAGQELARLDTAELRESVSAVEARAVNDAALYERGSKLVGDQMISRQEFDRLTAARDASAAELRKVQAALADATLTASFAGTVLRRNTRSGETVAAGAPVLRLADLSRMSVELGVPGLVVTRLKPGQEVSLTVSARPGTTFTGTISEVGASAANATRLFRVRIAIPNPQGLLRPGMGATVAISGDAPQPGSALVPLSALLADAKGRSFRVFVVGADGIARSRAVTVADVIGTSALLSSGVQPAERVVALGAGLCADGLRVTARDHDPDELYRRPTP
jgi:membrane fusion protein (multidrug efflux system)